MTAAILSELRSVQDPSQAAADILTNAPHGTRHHSAVACILALMNLGQSDAAIRATLEPRYIELTDPLQRRTAQRVFTNAMQWARSRIGPDNATIMADMKPALDNIGTHWAARWGRGG
jgi:hypothetical protein